MRFFIRSHWGEGIRGGLAAAGGALAEAQRFRRGVFLFFSV
jgi:hypothetical protein